MSAITVLGEPTIPLPTLVETIDALASALDAATPEARLAWLRSLGKAEVRRLWDLAAGRGVAAADVLRGEGVTIAEGRNTVPLFPNFQKRFARMSDGRIAGYNHTGAIARWFSGPGHFTVVDGPNGEAWVDYCTVHPEPHPEFPAPVANEVGFWPRFVYGNQVDKLRRVSAHVVVGDASRVKGGVHHSRSFWFAMVFP